MYKITKDETNDTKGRFSLLRNVKPNGTSNPYAEYYIIIEDGLRTGNVLKTAIIRINRLMEVIDACDTSLEIAKENEFKNIQEFTEFYKRDFNGYIE